VANNSYYCEGAVSLEIKRDMDFVRRIVNLGFDRLAKLLVIAVKPITRRTTIFR